MVGVAVYPTQAMKVTKLVCSFCLSESSSLSSWWLYASELIVVFSRRSSKKQFPWNHRNPILAFEKVWACFITPWSLAFVVV